MERIALVTGAGSGIGRAAALALLDAGWRVALAGRRHEALKETQALAANAGGRALPVPTDVTDEAQVKALFKAICNQFGRLDLLFNNAGMGGPPVSFDELTFEQWRKVAAVNLDGAFLCAREAFAMMRRQDPMGGRIINNGSISAHAPRPNSAPYTATKHAITGLTKSLALDGRPYDIACGQIDIGNAASDMASVMLRGVPQANGAIAPEPVMDLKHVADAVLHMASLPLDANVLFMTVMATKMPFVGEGVSAMLTLDHVVFPVRDADKTLAFYGDLLGLPLVQTLTGPDWGGYPWLMMIFGLGEDRELVTVALRGAPEPSYQGLPPDCRHYALAAASAAEVAEWRDRLGGAGVDFWEEQHGEQSSIYFPDPDGVILEITWPGASVPQMSSAAALERARAWIATSGA